MAYSELVKNFELIRDYMRQFYVFGFKNRRQYDAKSPRSYDNERRRIESLLADYMSFGRSEDGKRVFISVDSRSVGNNPLYRAFKAKSFTKGDITLHFYLLDILSDGAALSVGEIVDKISENYISHFDNAGETDISTIRKKLHEYEKLGIVESTRDGRRKLFRKSDCAVDTASWSDALAFFSEVVPLGFIGSTILDRQESTPDYFRFKHHYILDALNSDIIASLAEAISLKCRAEIAVTARGHREATLHSVYPVKIYISTQSGRQHLLCYHIRFKRPMLFRLDNIHSVVMGNREAESDKYESYCAAYSENLWGVSSGDDCSVERVQLCVHIDEGEEYILKRLEREKRCGRLEMPDKHTVRFTAEVYDTAELLPWIRTFIGRITSFSCSSKAVEKRFFDDLQAMSEMYGGDTNAVQ